MKSTGLVMFFVSAMLFGQAFLVPTDRNYSALSMKYHRVEALVKDGVAQTVIKQTFINPYSYDIEATYIFPLPERASVSKFRMKMNGVWTDGKVLEKNEAKGIYERIVSQMKDPGLIEYLGNNMFQARVYPVPRNGEMDIEITYTQMLENTGNLYNYTYPMKKGTYFNVKEDFTFTAKIESTVPIKAVYSPTHKMDIVKKDRSATVGFEQNSASSFDDIKIFYSVSEKDISASVLSYKENDDPKGYFMVMVAPKSELDDKEIENKNVLVVVDTSGSMAGENLEYAKKSLNYIVKRLHNKDKFNIIRFSSGVEPLFEKSVVADEDSRKKALTFIDDFVASGGTAIDEALTEALKQLDSNLTNLVIFITDGKPTVGETETKEILKNIKKANNKKAQIFSFGIGDELNSVLIDKIASENDGSSDYAKSGSEIESVVSNFYDKVAYPVLLNTKIEFKGAEISDIYPHKMPVLFKGQQLYIFGRYKAENGASMLIRLKGDKKGKAATYDFEVNLKNDEKNSFIPHIWATQKTGFLLDEIRLNGENKELVDEVIKIATKFGIVTPYTSYLVVEKESDLTVRPRPRPRPVFNRGGLDDFSASSNSLSGVGGGGSGKAYQTKAFEMKAESGKDAVSTSIALNKMKKGDKVVSTDDRKIVGSKTFLLRDGVWIDTATINVKAKKTVTVKYLSSNYMKLLKNTVLKKYLTIGENIDILFNGIKVEIRSETKESDIPSELLK